MKIAELFVALGLSGESKVVKGLKEVNENFKDVTSSSFQAKAMVAGAFIGMERLTAKASQTGMELFKFAKATGLSSIELQKWQYMAGQYGAAEDVQGTIEAIQRAMAQMELGMGMPRGFALLGIETEGKNAFQILDQLEAKVKGISPKLGLELVSGLGISSNMFQALRNINREKDKIDERLIIYDKERDKLKDINTEWFNFWYNLERIGTKLVGQFGSSFIGSLGNITKILRDVIDWFADFNGEWDGLKTGLIAAGLALVAAFNPVTATISGILLLLNDIQKFRNGEDSVIGAVLDPTEGSAPKAPSKHGKWFDAASNVFQTATDVGLTALGMKTTREIEADRAAERIMNGGRPLMAPMPPQGNVNNSNSTVTQIFNIDGRDMTSALSDSSKKEISGVFNLSVGRVGK